MIDINNNHGGARCGAGKKLKYGEKTVNLNVRVPKSKKAEIKGKFNKILKTYIKKPKGKQSCSHQKKS